MRKFKLYFDSSVRSRWPEKSSLSVARKDRLSWDIKNSMNLNKFKNGVKKIKIVDTDENLVVF